MDQPLDLDRTVTSARRAAAAGERVIVLGVTGSGYSGAQTGDWAFPICGRCPVDRPGSRPPTPR